MTKNLAGQKYADRFMVSSNMEVLSREAKDDQYRLGMVLYASAKQGDEKLYRKTLLSMTKDEKDSKQNSYNAWQLGRVLLAADCINDSTTVKSTLSELKTLLADTNTPKDAFTAWAWGYLAALNDDEYKLAKNNILTSAQILTEQYQKAKDNSQESKTALQAKLSDALWALVMNAQAAANAKDGEAFQFILEQIKKITGQNTVALALSTGLQRLSDSNDYPAWALSIVRLAAATIGDQALYKELEQPLQESIQGAKNAMNSQSEKIVYGARAEATLAQLDLALSIIRWNERLSLHRTSCCVIL